MKTTLLSLALLISFAAQAYPRGPNLTAAATRYAKRNGGLASISGDQYVVNFATRNGKTCKVQVDPMVRGYIFVCGERVDIESNDYLYSH